MQRVSSGWRYLLLTNDEKFARAKRLEDQGAVCGGLGGIWDTEEDGDREGDDKDGVELKEGF